MDDITIRFAKISDFKNITQFIEEHWNPNHIFVKYPELMKYQHLFEDELRWVIAEEKSHKIFGILGYIKYSISENCDLSPAIWKTISSTRPMLGIEMLHFLRDNIKHRIYIGCGANIKTIPLYNYLEMPVGELNHYYLLADKESYKIAIINNKKILQISPSKGKLTLFNDYSKLVENFDTSQYKENKPYKDEWYLKYRYYDYPVYQYDVYGVYVEDKCSSIIVIRKIEHNGACILRIVDYIGVDEDIAALSTAFQELIAKTDCEYIEFYNYGISDDILRKAGFSHRKENDNNILPSHFEPFEQMNIDLYFVTNDIDNLHVYKGDSDQDRLSMLQRD